MPREKSQPEQLVALLGRRDEPTDAVRDYCERLAQALACRGVRLTLAEMRWETRGWLAAFRQLWQASAAWRGRWVLVQFTELMWSRRGFSVPVLLVLAILKARGNKTCMVFHDAGVGAQRRGINRVRVPIQYRVMRAAFRWSGRSVFTLPLDCIPWLPAGRPAAGRPQKAAFIPVGANVPAVDELSHDGRWPRSGTAATVVVFGVSTFPRVQQREVEAIAHAVRHAALHSGALRLLVLGRGAREAEPILRRGLEGTSARLEIEGILPAEQVSRLLSSGDVFLFARGAFSSRRGSGLAAIACGLPVVAYRGEETGFPVTEAGLVLVEEADPAALAEALTSVLNNPDLQRRLRAKNLKVFQEWFSWDAIAGRLLDVLGSGSRAAASGPLQLTEVKTRG